MNKSKKRIKNRQEERFAKRMKEQRDQYYKKNPQLLGGKTWKSEKKDTADLWLERNDPSMR
jgi:hypothetical protein